ncbi:MAG: hypothetical protein WD847_02975 [Pirellulales bacterium]
MATRSRVTKLHNQVMDRWESYRTRRLPVDAQGIGSAQLTAAGFPANSSSYTAYIRLRALRELMRLEMPQRYEDVTSNTSTYPNAPAITPAVLVTTPTLSLAYLRRYNTAHQRRSTGSILTASDPPSPQFQGAECLYMIVTMGLEDNSLGTDKLSLNDIGDVDDDGMPEFIDAWGNPISFLRWAPGFDSDLQPDAVPATLVVDRDPASRPDPFDTTRIDRHPEEGFVDSNGDGSHTTGELFFDFNGNGSRDTNLLPRGFQLFPLIYSAGPDEAQDIWATNAGMTAAELSDPYHLPAAPAVPAGTPMTPTSSQPGEGRHTDNIHNHLLTSG